MGHLKERYDNSGNKINQYVDRYDRIVFIEFLKQVYNKDFIMNGQKASADLVCKSNPNFLFEHENGRWHSDHKNSNKSDTFGLGYQSINMSERKFYLVGLLARHDKWLDRNKDIEGFRQYTIDFGRMSKRRNQIFIIRNKILKDPKKYRRLNDEKVRNSTEPEDFITFHIDHCEEYNLQPNGLWLPVTNPNGKYSPETEEIQTRRIIEMKCKHAQEVLRKYKEKQKKLI